MARPGICGWGGGCDEPATAGKFSDFCPEHAAILAAVVVAKGRPTRPGARAEPPPAPVIVCALDGCERRAWADAEPRRCYTHRLIPAEQTIAPVAARCLVEGCGGYARQNRPTCGRHVLADVPEAGLAAFRAEQAARPRAKPGPKPKAAA